MTTHNAARQLPVLALRQLVLFPGTTLPIAAGRPKTLRAIEQALEQDEPLVFTVLQREDSEEIDSGNLFTVGTIARIDQVQRSLAGTQMLLSGVQRAIALRIDPRGDEPGGYLVATIAPADELEPQHEDDLAFTALSREVRERAGELGQKSGLPREVTEKVLTSINSSGRLADLVAGYLDVPPPDKQVLLETLSVEERLRKVLAHIERQIALLDAQADIKSQVEEEISDRQREIYLREQLRAIQKELGEDGDADDLAELREKLEGLELPGDAHREVFRELGRLERMGREGMEAQVIRTFLETVLELPWNEHSEEQLKLEHAAGVLDEDHYGLEDVKDRVLEFLAVRKMQLRDVAADADGSEVATETPSDTDATEATEVTEVTSTRDDAPTRRSPILLFTGPPGVGKTSLAKSIARAMGREYVRISLGGVRDESDIRGHRRTYVAAMPGRIIQGIKQAGTKNPVVLLDEVDKLGASLQGDPSAALLEVLDPAQNHTFTDHYLGIPFDLSQVLFIATANFAQNIPGPLLDRLESVEFAGYTEQEKLAIARSYLVPRQVENGGLRSDEIEIADAAIREVVSRYTREAGVRQLDRELGRLVRKTARRLADGHDGEAIVIGADTVGELLGRPRIHPEHALTEDQVGIASGLYYTPVGGDILFVEASRMPGKGNLVLTGQLGDVMQESARAAWTYARSHAEGLRIDPDLFEKSDLHVHVPAGAIPKDGPSAGITMATAMMSALSGRPVRHDIAMTGEITLSGRVLPIGGVKEKLLGAVRAGIASFVLPRDNERDLEDLPDEIRDLIEVHLVGELGEVLAVALRDASFEDGRLLFKGDDPNSVEPLSRTLH